MYRTDFPNLNWLKQVISRGFPGSKAPLWPNVIIHTKSHFQHRPNIKGTLSLFTNLSGVSYAEAGNNRVRINNQHYFVSNFEQEYTLDITQPTETFNLHFSKATAEDCLRNFILPETTLIDNPETNISLSNFWNILYPHTPASRHCINTLSKDAPFLDNSELETRLYPILNHLFTGQQDLLKTRQKLPASKASTRLETLKRLRVAHDYLHSNYTQPITLDDLANVACLSKFHFLRLFKRLFQCSPHAYLNRLRIEQACELLKTGCLTTGQVSELLGFEHVSSFCRTFHRIKGQWPGEYIT